MKTDKTSRGRGRPKVSADQSMIAEQMPLRLLAGTKARIAAALEDRESMADFARAAIERELERRRRS